MSFADELKSLTLTAPKERDTEDIFNEESTAKLTASSTDYETTPARQSPLVLEEAKYGGRSISRKELEMIEDEAFPDEQFELDPDLYEFRDNAQYVGKGNAEEFGGTSEREDSEVGEAANDSEDPQIEDEEDSELSEGRKKDDVHESDSGSSCSGDEELCDVLEKLKKSIPRKALTADDISEDVQKGISIRNQLAVWDKLLEYRIQFQKVLALSNQLPPSDLSAPVMKDFLKDAGNGHLYWQCTRNIARASKQLTAIRRQLIDLFPEVKKSLEKRSSENSGSNKKLPSDDEEIPSDIASGYSESEGEETSVAKLRPKKRLRPEEGSDATVKRLRSEGAASWTSDDFHGKFLAFRNSTIDKWYQRTKLGAGKSMRLGITVMEQPPLKQLNHIMADQERLIERTRLKRSAYEIVGIRTQTSADAVAQFILPEIFDDDDFYNHLLREVIERKTQDVSDPFEISRHWIEIQKLRSKMKRRVDTKASKGRRIRYDVIPKLVSFMTPYDVATYSEQARNDLFFSLFGRHAVVSRNDTQLVVSKEDLLGFKLFS